MKTDEEIIQLARKIAREEVPTKGGVVGGHPAWSKAYEKALIRETRQATCKALYYAHLKSCAKFKKELLLQGFSVARDLREAIRESGVEFELNKGENDGK